MSRSGQSLEVLRLNQLLRLESVPQERLCEYRFGSRNWAPGKRRQLQRDVDDTEIQQGARTDETKSTIVPLVHRLLVRCVVVDKAKRQVSAGIVGTRDGTLRSG